MLISCLRVIIFELEVVDLSILSFKNEKSSY